MTRYFFRVIVAKCLVINLLAIPLWAQAPSYDLRVEALKGKVKSIEEYRSVIVSPDGPTPEVGRQRHRSARFDESGRKTYEWSKIDKLDPFEHFYSYDANTRLKRTLRSGAGSIESHSYSLFSYDDAARILSENVFPGKQVENRAQTQGYTFRFDANGCLVEEVMLTAQKKPLLRKEYIYTDGKCSPGEVRLGLVSGAGRVQTIRYSYELDEKGNWKKRTVVNTLADESGTLKVEVIDRTIDYYP